MKEAISTHDAPTPVGPYSQAIRCGKMVHMAGQIALDPATGEIVVGGCREHAERVFENLSNVAKAAGGTLDDVVKVTLFLTDMAYFNEVNAVAERYFSKPYPARSTVAVSTLPRGSLVEVDAVLMLE